MINQSLRIEAASHRRPNIAGSNILYLGSILILMLLVTAGHAETIRSPAADEIKLDTIPPDGNGGYGYRLQYYVPLPIDEFWLFKTDFDSDLLLSNDELIGHRLISKDGNSVITQNRYASAPALRFLWETTVIPEQHRLEFSLLNAEDCRHDFHFGSIQLSPAGGHTKVTQTAYFDFVGASLWVRYPWYGGMKSTLTNLAKWEQQTMVRYWSDPVAAAEAYTQRKNRVYRLTGPQH